MLIKLVWLTLLNIPFPVLQSPHLALSCLSQLALQNVFMWKEAVILFCGQHRIIFTHQWQKEKKRKRERENYSMSYTIKKKNFSYAFCWLCHLIIHHCSFIKYFPYMHTCYCVIKCLCCHSFGIPLLYQHV